MFLLFLTLNLSFSILANGATSENSESDTFAMENSSNGGSARLKREGGESSSLTNIMNTVFNQKTKLLGSFTGVSSSSSGNKPNAPPPKPLDWAEIKKSVKSSIFSALKAITGGVIALNGQLVRAKGYIVAAAGQFIATKGEKISDVGKNLATNAFKSSDDSGSISSRINADGSETTTPSETDTQPPSGAGKSESALEEDDDGESFNQYPREADSFSAGYRKYSRVFA